MMRKTSSKSSLELPPPPISHSLNEKSRKYKGTLASQAFGSWPSHVNVPDATSTVSHSPLTSTNTILNESPFIKGPKYQNSNESIPPAILTLARDVSDGSCCVLMSSIRLPRFFGLLPARSTTSNVSPVSDLILNPIKYPGKVLLEFPLNELQYASIPETSTSHCASIDVV